MLDMKRYFWLVISFLSFSTHTFAGVQEDNPFTYGIGYVNITLLSESQGRGNTDILIGATAEMIDQSAPEGKYANAVNVFLIEMNDNNILVDAGFGKNLYDHLKVCGKAPEDINSILMTHLHGDHIGGLLKEGKPAFPNAALYISQPEYDFWMSDEAMNKLPENGRGAFVQARNIIAQYRDRLKLFVPESLDNVSHELLPGIKAVAAYGHTPGHTAFMLESEGDRLLIWGDLTHAMAVQIPYPHVAVTYDVDPDKAVETRLNVLKYVADNKIKIAGMHIEYPGMGEINGSADAGYQFKILCTCEGLLR